MFVGCAQAPGRIDGVVLLCVNGVLVTNHSASLVMRAAQGASPIGMSHGGLEASTASSGAGKKPRGVL